MGKLKDTELLDTLQSLVKNAGVDGTWNYDAYLHGMFNGMELMLAVVEDREPIFRDAPSEWLYNNTTEAQPSSISQ